MRLHTIITLFISILCCCATTADTEVSPTDFEQEGLVEEDPPLGGLEDHLLLRIDVEPGHTVSFYEPESGVVGMVELFEAGQEPLAAQHHTAAKVYRALRGEEPVPMALRDALARAAAIPESEVLGAAAERGGGGPANARGGSITQFLDAGFCDVSSHNAAYVRWTFCRASWGNSFWAYDGGARTIDGIVYNNGGTMTTRVQVNQSIFDLNQSSGQNAYFTFGNSTAGMRRMDLLNAEGDVFHVVAKFFNHNVNIGWW